MSSVKSSQLCHGGCAVVAAAALHRAAKDDHSLARCHCGSPSAGSVVAAHLQAALWRAVTQQPLQAREMAPQPGHLQHDTIRGLATCTCATARHATPATAHLQAASGAQSPSHICRQPLGLSCAATTPAPTSPGSTSKQEWVQESPQQAEEQRRPRSNQPCTAHPHHPSHSLPAGGALMLRHGGDKVAQHRACLGGGRCRQQCAQQLRHRCGHRRLA